MFFKNATFLFISAKTEKSFLLNDYNCMHRQTEKTKINQSMSINLVKI